MDKLTAKTPNIFSTQTRSHSPGYAINQLRSRLFKLIYANLKQNLAELDQTLKEYKGSNKGASIDIGIQKLAAVTEAFEKLFLDALEAREDKAMEPISGNELLTAEEVDGLMKSTADHKENDDSKTYSIFVTNHTEGCSNIDDSKPMGKTEELIMHIINGSYAHESKTKIVEKARL
jgi:hypothetical protein